MKTLTVDEARIQFDSVVAAKNAEPVEITRDGARLGIYLPHADAELIEDLLLAQKVAVAKTQGTLGLEASAQLLARLRNAED